MVIVVSDTSPIRALVHLGLLDLLRAIYGDVFIPPAVLVELQRVFPETGGRQIIPDWVHVKAVSDSNEIRRFRSNLHAGESEALALALELDADYVLIDEEARRRGLNPVGALGVLLQAKKSGMIPAIGPLISSLRADLNFFVSEKLEKELLRLADE